MRLGELCAPKQWKSLKQSEMASDGYPVYGANGVIGYYSEYNHEEETILVGCRGTCGEVNLCAPYSYVTSNAMCLDRLSDRVDRDYLICFLKAYNFGRVIGGTSQPQITKAGISSIEVPLFSLEKQIVIRLRLKSILDELVSCKALLAKLDTLVKSRFVEMFGDPISNSKGLETQPGSALFKIVNGKTKPMDERYETGFPAYGGNGVSWYSQDSLVDFPTIVVGRVGRHCGNVHLVNDPCWVTDNAMYIKRFHSNELDLIYLDELMRVVGFNRYADRGDLWKITQQPFMEFNYPMPPLAQQQELAAFVRQVDKSRFNLLKAYGSIIALFRVLFP